jgi:Fe2+ transport system protein FeoA
MAEHLLTDLADGTSARVVGYRNGDRSRRRFAEMGLVPGTRITRIRSAPLGDPVEYSVFGARLAIRSRDASRLVVEPLP